MNNEEKNVKLVINEEPQDEAAAPRSSESAMTGEAMSAEMAMEREGKSDNTSTGASEQQGETTAERDADASPQPLPSIGEMIRQEVKEGEEVPPGNFTMSRVLGGTLILGIFQRQVKLVLLITVFLIIYITCRYQCQKQMVEIDRLERKLVTIRYKATVYSCELTEMSRESNILDMLAQRGDSTLVIPKEPPYKINIPE